jgi:hypothetical protein
MENMTNEGDQQPDEGEPTRKPRRPRRVRGYIASGKDLTKRDPQPPPDALADPGEAGAVPDGAAASGTNASGTNATGTSASGPSPSGTSPGGPA